LYWPSRGGAEQVVQILSERMARDGNDVTVVTTDAASAETFWNRRGPRVEQRDERFNGVRIVHTPVASFPLGQWALFLTRSLAIRVFDPLRLTKTVRHIGAWMPRAPQLRSTLERLGPFDLVHGFNLSWEASAIDAHDFARTNGLRYVMTPFMHTGEPGRARVSRNYTMSHQRAALCGSDRVIVQTSTEARAIEALGVERSRIVEVGVGIDPARLRGGDPDRFRARSNGRSPLVVFIGRVTRDKGATAVVRAMQQLWADGVDVECIVAGSIMPDFDRFRRALPPLPRLQLLGPIDDQVKRDLLAAADVVVMPSRAESFGIVYLEAWLYGKPVIGARAGGVPDIIADGVDGWLVNFDDASQIAQAIQHLLGDPAQAAAMGAHGHAKVEQYYTWDRIYGLLANIYGDLIEQRKR
jgi:glycosyltransferase involved in cell wall biosynthesis